MVTALSRHAYSWAIDLGLEPIDAQDVAQSAIEVLLRKADTVERGVVTVWLWRVVLHKAQELRRCRREAMLATERQPDRAAPDPDPEVTLRSAELGAAVQRALAEIPASKRRILEAVALEERSLAEVAREEGVPESTVRSRLQVATDQLRGSLERRRREESRRTGGHTSWLLLPWAGDVRAGWRALAALPYLAAEPGPHGDRGARARGAGVHRPAGDAAAVRRARSRARGVCGSRQGGPGPCATQKA